MTREGKEEDEQEDEGKGRHLALLPLPFEGHINPMLQLANLLHSKGFSITIIHPKFNPPNPSNHPNFRFEIIPVGFSDPSPIKYNIAELISAFNTNYKDPLRDCLVRLQQLNPFNTISCLITDAMVYCTQAVAEELGLPRIVLRTSNPLSFLAWALDSLLVEKGYLSIQGCAAEMAGTIALSQNSLLLEVGGGLSPGERCLISDHQSELPVEELPPLRVKDLPVIPNTEVNVLSQFYDKIANNMRNATALILNSYDHLEQAILPELRREFLIPIFCVGPLCKSSPGFSSSLLEQDQSCLDWLDKQAARSVLYVSFGSVAKMEEVELVETAWGLANSEQPFLWVVRPGLVAGSEGAWPGLPEGFLEKTRGKGWIVKWAPQQQVLAHPAVGGFWTHSGWNSTLESICSGVPMICWPHFGDQPVIARLVSYSWKVGLQLEGDGLERGEIEKAIKKLMVDKEGKEMGERIRVLKEIAEMCVRKGGSSYESINKLVNLILSL